MSLELIEQMVRAANPVPDVAILGGSVSHRGHLSRQETATTETVEMPLLDRAPDAPTDQPGRAGTVHSLNGVHVGDADVLDTHPTSADDLGRERHPRRLWMLVAAAGIVVLSLGLAVVAVQEPDSVPTDTVPPTPAPSTNPATTSPPVDSLPATIANAATVLPPGPFVGIWVSTDTDGSSQTMEIVGSGGDDYEFVLRDDFATACSGAPATMTGSGLLETDERLVIAQPELTCDDGTLPRIGPSPQAELANFTFELDTATNELVDSSEVVWQRAVVDFPNLTTTFVSPRNGFSIKHPDRVALTPANDLWDSGNEETDRGVDVVETGLAAVFKGASHERPGGPISIDEYVDAYVSRGGCGGPRSQQAEITIDGRSGRISECPNEIEATVVAGGRLYLFTLLSDRSDARAVFDAFAATIRLTPETAVDLPNLTTTGSTFVSPTNGFSVMYLDRGEGSLTPAKELWDPVIQPPIDEEGEYSGAPHDDAFDVMETGYAAVFKSGQDLGLSERNRRNRRCRRSALSLHAVARAQ